MSKDIGLIKGLFSLLLADAVRSKGSSVIEKLSEEEILKEYEKIKIKKSGLSRRERNEIVWFVEEKLRRDKND